MGRKEVTSTTGIELAITGIQGKERKKKKKKMD